MSYDIRRTAQFKRDFKKILSQGKDVSEFTSVLNLLVEGKPLPEKYGDHPLWNSKEYKNCRELHIQPDWLLVYKYSNQSLILYLIRTGSHSELMK